MHADFTAVCIQSLIEPPRTPPPSPQAITAVTALTLARDEVFWLFKHNAVSAPKGKGRNLDDYSDSALPELIFQMVQLKGTFYLLHISTCTPIKCDIISFSHTLALLRKYYRVIQSYFLRYMSGFDAAFMRDVVMVSGH